MMPSITLKKAQKDDIPFITGLLNENGLPFSDIPEIVSSLFVADIQGEVVGVGGVELYERYGLLRSLAVKQEFRNRGYGVAITKGLVDHAKKSGVFELYLLTMTAAPFFERLGFSRIDRDKAPKAIKETGEFSCL
jgi:amino-acid N-acetyltransferase